MTYKFEYEDVDHNKHTRYYNALNLDTAKVMFKATMEHIQGDSGREIEGIQIKEVLEKKENHWEPTFNL